MGQSFFVFSRAAVPAPSSLRPASVLPVEDLRHFYAGNTSGLFRIDS